METHVKFYQMDGFKPIDESDKIVTEDFLNSSREVVCIVGKPICPLFYLNVH